MKHLFKFYCISAFLLAFFQLNAQTVNGRFTVHIGNDPTIWTEGECGWSGTIGWGGSITEDICSPIVWLKDQPGGVADSLACDTVINDYTGKWVLIRRGDCEFQRKVLNAELAGASGVIIANHNSISSENECTVVPLGTIGIAFIHIPTIFACRKMSKVIEDAIAAGNGQTELCVKLPRLDEPYTSMSYATPSSQLDTISTLAIRIYNRHDIMLTNVVLKADIIDPQGQITTLVKALDLPENSNQLVVFDKYLPQGGMGKYEVVFSSSAFTEPRDTIRSGFLVSRNSFAHDIVAVRPGGVGPTATGVGKLPTTIQNAGLYLTGPNGGKATYATFGIGNVSIVATPDPTANIINIILYDADANDDGTVDLFQSFDDLNSNGIVGIGEYSVDPFLKNDSLISIPLFDLTGNLSVNLEPNHPYYLSLRYDGTLAGTGFPARFTCTNGHNYFGVLNDAGDVISTTPVFIDQLLDEYQNREIVERLELEGFTPPSGSIHTRPTPLSASKFNITPNPATDFLKLELKLDAVNSGVSVSLMDYNGRTVQTQTAKNFQNGQFRFDTAQLPSGNYLIWISTGEGSAARPVAICH